MVFVSKFNRFSMIWWKDNLMIFCCDPMCPFRFHFCVNFLWHTRNREATYRNGCTYGFSSWFCVKRKTSCTNDTRSGVCCNCVDVPVFSYRLRILGDKSNRIKHLNGSFFVCDRICTLRWLFRWNFFKQCWHSNGFSPEWMRIWLTKLDLFEPNNFSQTKHSYTRRLHWFPCSFRWSSCKNPRWHFEQRNGCGPAWSFMWLLRLPFSVNCLKHCLHSNGLLPLCTHMCFTKCDFIDPNDSWHKWHS